MVPASSYLPSICRLVSLSVRRFSRCVPNSGSFTIPPNVNIAAAADLPLPVASCIIEIVQKDPSKSEVYPKVHHVDGQPLRVLVSKGSDLRRCVGQGLQLAAQFKANSTIALSFGDQPVSDSDATTAAEVVTVHAYSPSTWKKADALKTIVQSCSILGASTQAVKLGHDVGNAINMARRLGDLPPNVATPAYMAAHAVQLCEPSQSGSAKLMCTVLDERDCASLGMNLLLAVGSGSANPPRVIALEHCPPGLEGSQPVLLVGKGVTFDSGGISIKPSAKMEV
jgi:leucyl aminopeptidase